MAFAPFASRSPFEVWVVPRRHDADFGRRPTPDIAATAEALRQVLGRLATSLDGPPYNLVLHTAPLREQVDATYHWHWEIHPRLREIAGLELGTGLPVNPVSPEDAVEELLGRAGAVRGGDGLMRPAPSGAPASHAGRPPRLWPTSARAHRASRSPPARSRPEDSHRSRRSDPTSAAPTLGRPARP